jgi:spore maturation protein CgeB
VIKMKILIVSSWGGEIYAPAVYEAFKKLGHDTYKFSWKEYFRYCQSTNYNVHHHHNIRYFFCKLQNKFSFGPILNQINKDFIASAKEIKPDLIFIYTGRHICASSIEKIKQDSNCKIYAYNNDDPFSEGYSPYFWRHYKESLPYCDHVFSFRHKNIDDYKNIGIKKTSLLRFYYISKNIFPIVNIEKKHDVVFIGHFENDGRDDILKYLIENKINIKLFGSSWEKSKHYNFFVSMMGCKITPIVGEAYNRMINESKIALVFLSKLNNDTYTTRCFEIPATKTMMISEYTNDLFKMFKEGKEVEFFRNKKELLEKLEFYLGNPNSICKIAEAGFCRVVKDGYEVKDFAKKILEQYCKQ